MTTTIWTPTADSETTEADLLEQMTPAAEIDLDTNTPAIHGAERAALSASDAPSTPPRGDIPEHDLLDQLRALADDDADDEYEHTRPD